MKLSVAMITYNHERFISQAIESVLMQKTTFEYELVIGEDCSTDRTGDIVRQYQERCPDKIRLLRVERNLGAVPTFYKTVQACIGQYVALLEGDDYWTSPTKLQQQVDFLDSHPKCSICFHPVTGFYQDNEKPNYVVPSVVRDYSTIEDLLKEMFIHTCSVVYRNGLIAEYPKWLLTLRMGDWPLLLMHAQHGGIACMNDIMAAHRIHSGGVWSNLDHILMYFEFIKMYEGMDAHLNGTYTRIIRPILADYYYKLAIFYDQKGDVELARKYLMKALTNIAQNRSKPSLNQLKMLARLSSPSFYAYAKRIVQSYSR